MKVIRTLIDNSTLLVALVLAALGLWNAFGPDLTKGQQSAIMTFFGALIAVLAVLLTTAKRRVVTQVDNSGVIRAGAASTQQTGMPSEVVKDPETGLLTPQTPVKPDLLGG